MEKMKRQTDLSNIVFSLSRGKFDGESRNKIFITYIMLVVLFGLGIILAVTMLTIEYINDKSMLAEYIGALISITIGFSIVPCVCFVLIYRNEKIRKDILEWIEDSIELNAYCKSLSVKYWLGIPLNKLQTEFDIDGIHYVRVSDNEKRGALDFGRPIGYYSGVSKYVDKEVKILYSPRYDQVLILKN